MKEYKELEDRYDEITRRLDELFGCEYGGELTSLLYDLLKFAEYANGIIEDAKLAGTYDAVLHKRDKEELEDCVKENKRLRGLVSVGIAVEYMKNIYAIDDDSYRGSTERMMADNQLKDRVKAFLNMFTSDES